MFKVISQDTKSCCNKSALKLWISKKKKEKSVAGRSVRHSLSEHLEYNCKNTIHFLIHAVVTYRASSAKDRHRDTVNKVLAGKDFRKCVYANENVRINIQFYTMYIRNLFH